MEQVTVYIRLIGEGTNVWRPVRAVAFEPDMFEIATDAVIPDDEEWEFKPGERVCCQKDEVGRLVTTVRAIR